MVIYNFNTYLLTTEYLNINMSTYLNIHTFIAYEILKTQKFN